MRRGIGSWMGTVVLWVLLGAVPAQAQTPDNDGMAWGAKGGWLRADYAVKGANDIFNASSGWFIGAFGGRKEPDWSWLQGELNILRKSTLCGCNQERVDLYYLQIAGLGRVNLADRSEDAVTPYALAGPALEIKIGETLRSLIIREYSGADVAIVLGGGVEFGRLLLEARATWGLRHLVANPADGTKVSSRTVAILGGFRFK
jgi:hypothetical protein